MEISLTEHLLVKVKHISCPNWNCQLLTLFNMNGLIVCSECGCYITPSKKIVLPKYIINKKAP